MTDAPLPDNEAERLDWLRQSRLLDTPAEDAFDDITRLAAQVCGVPIAAVSLIDEERQWFKSIVGLPVSETPRDVAFCAHAILQPEVMVVPDATQDARFADNPLVTGQPDIRFYAGAPLVTSDGFALGSLCVIDRVPRELTDEQKTVLEVLARQVAGRIEMQRSMALQKTMAAEQGRLIAQQEEAERRLEENEQRYRSLFDHNPHAVFSFDLTGRFLSANAACETLVGYTSTDLLGTTFQRLIDPEQFGRVYHYFSLAVQGQPQSFETEVIPQGGHHIPIAVTAIPIVIDGSISGVYGIAENITERKQAAAALRESDKRLRLALESGGFGTWDLDTQRSQRELSASVKALFGIASDAPFTSTDFLAAVFPEDLPHMKMGVEQSFQTGQPIDQEFRVTWPDGSVHWLSAHASPVSDDTGTITGVIGVTQDITERKAQEAERDQALREAQERADRDPLTGLWNHRAFHARLDMETARVQRMGGALAVVLLDIDNFKFFNDAHGHVVGDEVLRQVAGRLQQICRSYNTVARFGGDEFALILPGSGSITADEVEARLRADLGGLAYHLEEHEMAIPITVSLGAALFSAYGQDRHEALRAADERLRRVKTGGDIETEADQVRSFAQDTAAGFSMLDALVAAVDNKDRYTRSHSEDVMAYSLTIARELGLDEAMCKTVAVAALVHDVGKVGVPDAILRKPGKLTEAEFEAIQQHPQMGAIMVSTVPGLEATLDAVRHHHERWDGGGYPAGLRAAETPLIARLMAVADAFSAMTTDRPYRKGMSPDRALAILDAGAGTQWDPQCVAAFLRAQRPGQNAGHKTPDLAEAPESISA